jgi:CHASE1-domain containing sensor protein
MDKAIVTVLLIICGIVATMAMFNGLYPAISQSQGAISAATDQAAERLQSRIEIIQAGASGSQVKLWVKNIGATTIDGINRCDVLFGTVNNPIPMVFAAVAPPSWNYQLVGAATEWEPAATIGVTITLENPVVSGTYLVKLITGSGVSDEITFSVA